MALERRLGVTVQPTERVLALEEAALDRRSLAREHEALGYHALSYVSQREDEPTPEHRRQIVKDARRAYARDPMYQGVVKMIRSFAIGRGVSMPRAKDPQVQKEIEDAWNDVDNKAVLTSYDAQTALCADAIIQANVFYRLFDDGTDGKVKLALFDHDDVENVVPDPELNQNALYFLVRDRVVRWDYKLHRPERVQVPANGPRFHYYEHWTNVAAAEEAGRDFDKPPPELLGKGRVYHVRLNRASSSAHFGTPEFQSQSRWYGAYNEMMTARVTMVRAAAALYLRRKIKGTARQVENLATKAMSRSSWISGVNPVTGDPLVSGPSSPGAILHENEGVEHEQIKIDTGAANAQTDQQSIRAQISAGTGLPQHYLGDPTQTSLATAASLELPVLKTVESFQEVIEGLFRWFIDQVIEKAVDAGRISEERDPEEVAGKLVTAARLQEAADRAQARMDSAGRELTLYPRKLAPMSWPDGDGLSTEPTLVLQDGEGKVYYERILVEGHEGKTTDESDTQRDLSYEFKIPSPLKRDLTALVTAASQTAQALDPNGSNINLTRFLAGIIFGEGFEVENPQEQVDAIWPEDYVDPVQAAMMQQVPGQPGEEPPVNTFGPEASGTPVPTMADLQGKQDNPYGVKQKGTPGALQTGGKIQQSVLIGRRRDGEELRLVTSGHYRDRVDGLAQNTFDAHASGGEELWEDEVGSVIRDELQALLLEG